MAKRGLFMERHCGGFFMIRVKIELIPAGVQELAVQCGEITLGCKFPLTGGNQNLFVMSGMNYAEIKKYPIRDALCALQTGKPEMIDIVGAAVAALQGDDVTRRSGGEIYPGMLAVEPEIFDEVMTRLVDKFSGEIESIYLYGTRIWKNTTHQAFIDRYKLHFQAMGVHDGNFLLEEFPSYIPYLLLVNLNPDLYQKSRDPESASSCGAILEREISYGFSFRDVSLFQAMRCYNGLEFYFRRPNGGIVSMQSVNEITPLDLSTVVIRDVIDDRFEGQAVISRKLIYNQELGLQSYPGIYLSR